MKNRDRAKAVASVAPPGSWVFIQDPSDPLGENSKWLVEKCAADGIKLCWVPCQEARIAVAKAETKETGP